MAKRNGNREARKPKQEKKKEKKGQFHFGTGGRVVSDAEAQVSSACTRLWTPRAGYLFGSIDGKREQHQSEDPCRDDNGCDRVHGVFNSI